MCRMALRIHESARRERIGRTVFLAHPVQHQFGAIIQLRADPIPTRLVRRQLLGEKLMIHPGQSRHAVRLPSNYDCSCRLQSCQGNIMRGMSRSSRFLADSILTVDDGRLLWIQKQRKRELLFEHLQLLLIVPPPATPISVPDPSFCGARACDTRSRPVGALLMVKPGSLNIAQRGMRQVNILNIPGLGFLCGAIHTFPEKRQLESEFMTVTGRHIPGVIPPFGLKFFMVEVVAREFILVSWCCLFVLSSRWPREE